MLYQIAHELDFHLDGRMINGKLFDVAKPIVDVAAKAMMIDYYEQIKRDPSILQPEEDNVLTGLQSHGRYSTRQGDRLLEYLTRPFSKFANKKLVPTYSYARTYTKGSILSAHRDRPACQYSMTLCIGTEESNGKTWDFFCSDPNADKSNVPPINVDLYVPIVYKGLEARHWRDPLPFKSSTHLFLHYVDKDDPEMVSEWYDGRDYLNI